MRHQATAGKRGVKSDPNEIIQRLQKVFSAHDKQMVLSPGLSLQDLDWDSLRRVQVMIDVEREFGMSFDDAGEWSELVTVADLVQVILSRAQK